MADCQLTKIIGNNIAEQRKKLGLSQKELASQLEIAQDSLSRIERGVSTPTIKRLEQIAKCLGCSVALLVIDASSKSPEKALSIAKQLENLSANQQELAWNIIKAAIDTLAKQK